MPQPNQNVERQCSLCGKWRGLNQFSASQRKKGDDAACVVCIPQIQNVKPGQQKQDMDTSDAKYIAHTGTITNSTNGSLINKTGGVHLTTSAMSSAITAGSGNASVAGTGAPTHNSAASAAASSSRLSSTTNGNEPAPTWTVRDNGWIHIPNGFREEIVPELEDDDVETFNDDDAGSDYSM